MKIILLGDVHGNLPALEAVLEDGRRRGGDIVLNTGDTSDRGRFRTTVRLLLSRWNRWPSGNFDWNVLRAKQERPGEGPNCTSGTGDAFKENRSTSKPPTDEEIPARGQAISARTAPGGHRRRTSAPTLRMSVFVRSPPGLLRHRAHGHTHAPSLEKDRRHVVHQPERPDAPLETTSACYAAAHPTRLLQGEPLPRRLRYGEDGRRGALPGMPDFASSFCRDGPSRGISRWRTRPSASWRQLFRCTLTTALRGVHRLALFDRLEELHGLDRRALPAPDRSTLHDIGWLKGRRSTTRSPWSSSSDSTASSRRASAS